jgi:hypothetical protein
VERAVQSGRSPEDIRRRVGLPARPERDSRRFGEVVVQDGEVLVSAVRLEGADQLIYDPISLNGRVCLLQFVAQRWRQ